MRGAGAAELSVLREDHDEPGGFGLEVRGDSQHVPSTFVADFGPDREELVASTAFAGDSRP